VGRRWYAANRERKAEYQSRWRSENPDYQREWYEDNRERKAKAGRVWRSANPGKARAVWRTCQQRRRATIAEATVEPFTARDLRRDWEDHDLYGCFFCGGTLTDGYEVEHFYALSKGGPHAVFNLVPSCVPCNRGAGGKGTKEPWGYLREALEEQGVDSDAVQAGVEAAIEARCRRRRPTLTDVSGSAFTTPTVMKSTTPV
jgi:5-methylcytosine-specific restriction endonuclease McrA